MKGSTPVAGTLRASQIDAGRDPDTGKRDTTYVTVRGTKREAQEELNRLLSRGTLQRLSRRAN